MASQAFFLASVNISSVLDETSSNGVYVNAGYSAIGIIFTIGIGVVALLVLVGMGFRRYRK